MGKLRASWPGDGGQIRQHKILCSTFYGQERESESESFEFMAIQASALASASASASCVVAKVC